MKVYVAQIQGDGNMRSIVTLDDGIASLVLGSNCQLALENRRDVPFTGQLLRLGAMLGV